MADPVLVPRDALRGVSVAVSVSDSRDLVRLGLAPAHCRFAVAEIARAVLLAGGSLVYGGNLDPGGFTQVLMDEVRRYSERSESLTICVPASEHRGLTAQSLHDADDGLGTAARITLLDVDGDPIDRHDWSARTATDDADVPRALTAMRRHVTDRSAARVVVGGKLARYKGDLPGVLEEALMSMAGGRPLYVAGGFGGAAAAAARALGHDTQTWAPAGFPLDVDDEGASTALRRLRDAAASRPLPDDGLSDHERRQLAASHRPGDIATLVVLGLARASARRTTS